MNRGLSLVLLLLFCISGLAAQNQVQNASQIETGKTLFQNARYQEALSSFRESLTDPRLSLQRAEAYFWTSKTLYALERWEEAARSFDSFLAQYPGDRNTIEAEYLRARIYFLSADYESAIQLFARFIQRYPTSPFVPNAYYWTGESFFSQGNLLEARQVYEIIANSYKTSSRYEAAQYRLEVLDLKQKEQELIQLLRWTQEESIRLSEEFRQQERAYQQAIQSLRSQPNTSNVDSSAASVHNELIEAQSRVQTLLLQNQRLAAQLAEIQASLDQSNRRIEELALASQSASGTLTTSDAMLLEMKADLLEAKESLIQSLLEDLE